MSEQVNQEAFEEFPFHHNQKPFRAGFAQKGFYFRLHYHDAVEIIVVTRGFLQMDVDHQKYVLNQGDWLAIGSHHMHAYEAFSEDVQFYMVMMATDLFQGFNHYEDLFLMVSPYLYQVTKGHIKKDEDACKELLMSMAECYQTQKIGYELDMLHHFFHLLKQLWATAMVEIQEADQQKHLYQNYDFVKRFHRVLFNQYATGLSLNQASELMGYSPYHFTRKFKQVMGMGFKDYVNRFMIKRAGMALEQSSNNITEIALQHGFNSVKTFHRVFVDHYGKSPSDYRRAINEKSKAISDKH